MATLRHGSQPTGEITFALHGPADPTCSGAPLFTTATIVTGNGTYNSESFTPTTSGTYRWIATYSGDAANLAGSTLCGESTERVDVTVPAQPQLLSSASAAVTLGGAIHDTAHLSGGSSPGGTIRFRLYGARDAGCTRRAVFTSTVSVSGNGDYDSGSYVPARSGEYRWVAVYSGDARNLSAGPTACGEDGEVASIRPPTIKPAATALSTTAAPAGLGSPTSDTAHLTGGRSPTGAVTFELFGPDDASCAAPPIFVASTPVSGDGDYTTPEFVLPRPGTYRWVASYSGDLDNTGAGPTTCGAPGETAVADSTPRPGPDPGPHVPLPELELRPQPKPPPPVPSPQPPSVTG